MWWSVVPGIPWARLKAPSPLRTTRAAGSGITCRAKLLTEPQLQRRRWPWGTLRRLGARRGSSPRRYCRRCHLPSPEPRPQSRQPKSSSRRRLAFSPAADAAGTERHVMGAGSIGHAHLWALPRPHTAPLRRLQFTRSFCARPLKRSKKQPSKVRFPSSFISRVPR